MYETVVYALKDTERFFEAFPEISTTAARMAINTVAERSGMKLLREEIEREVAFPAGYVNADRLKLIKKAYNADLTAIIWARQRPTSLARFVRGALSAGQMQRKGVAVSVRPGVVRNMPSAFLLRLRAGTSVGDNNFNTGLAIRLKPGQRIINKREQSAVQLEHNLYLLYGPSVDQVFRTVAETKGPMIADLIGVEFTRNLTRLLKEDARG